jgi:hypothetical protein
MGRILLQIDWKAGVGDRAGVQFTLPGSLETMAQRWGMQSSGNQRRLGQVGMQVILHCKAALAPGL